MKQHLITSAVGTSVTFDAKILNHEQLKHLGAFATEWDQDFIEDLRYHISINYKVVKMSLKVIEVYIHELNYRFTLWIFSVLYFCE